MLLDSLAQGVVTKSAASLLNGSTDEVNTTFVNLYVLRQTGGD